MHLSAHPSRVTAGLAGLAALASLGGTAAVMAARTGSHQGQHAQAVAPAGGARVAGIVAEPAVTQRPTMPTRHPLGAATRAARPAQPLTAAQAVALAAAVTKAHVDEVEAVTGPPGTTYDVKLVRADGSEVAVLVVARTGEVSVTHEQDQAARADERPPGDEPVPDEPSAPSDAPGQ
jgi:uncharacterized membrane protein YkoI